MDRKNRKSRGGWFAALRISGAVLVLWGWLLSAGITACYGQEAAGQQGADPAGAPVLPVSYAQEAAGSGSWERYVNPDTGYRVVVEDRAGLLDPEQLQELSRIMEPVTAYGNAAFVTVRRNTDSTETFARSYYRDRFGTDSGTVFVIDLDHRNLWIHSGGAVWQVVTAANASTVTDNVYRYASKGDYYQCGAEAFRQIQALLKGKKIPRSMKYISNALLALILALLANYGLVIWSGGLHKPGEKAVLAAIDRKFAYQNLQAIYTHQTRTYDPVSSGGGGHHGGGGRGGGGGGRSGGGGGHGF